MPRLVPRSRAALAVVIAFLIPLGLMAIALARMAPHAAPDPPAIAALAVTVMVLVVWRAAPLKAMLGGAVFGILRDRVSVWARS